MAVAAGPQSRAETQAESVSAVESQEAGDMPSLEGKSSKMAEDGVSVNPREPSVHTSADADADASVDVSSSSSAELQDEDLSLSAEQDKQAQQSLKEEAYTLESRATSTSTESKDSQESQKNKKEKEKEKDKEKDKEKEQKKPRRKRPKVRSRGSFLLSLLLFVLFCVGLYQTYSYLYDFTTDPLHFRVSRVEINGQLKLTTQEEIADVVGKMAGERNLVTLDIAPLHNALLQLPWVAEVKVQKRYPDGIEVTLVEHVASARWNSAGLYDAQRRSVFYPDMQKFNGALVTLSAPHDSQAPILYEHAFKFVNMTRNTPYLIEEVQLDAASSYRVRLQGDVWLILGRESTPDLPLIRLKRFLLAFGETRLKLSEVAYVDLRYDNGFAVGERATVEAEQAAAAAAAEAAATQTPTDDTVPE